MYNKNQSQKNSRKRLFLIGILVVCSRLGSNDFRTGKFLNWAILEWGGDFGKNACPHQAFLL